MDRVVEEDDRQRLLQVHARRPLALHGRLDALPVPLRLVAQDPLRERRRVLEADAAVAEVAARAGEEACAGVPCMYTFSALGKMNLARPSEFLGPGFWRTKRRPETTRARFSCVDGQGRRVVVAASPRSPGSRARSSRGRGARAGRSRFADDAGGGFQYGRKITYSMRSMKIGVLCSSDLPTTTFMRSGSSAVFGSVAHRRKSGTFTNRFACSLTWGSQRMRSMASWICRTRWASGDVQARDRSRAEDAVRFQAVAALEALHGVDERRVVRRAARRRRGGRRTRGGGRRPRRGRPRAGPARASSGRRAARGRPAAPGRPPHL